MRGFEPGVSPDLGVTIEKCYFLALKRSFLEISRKTDFRVEITDNGFDLGICGLILVGQPYRIGNHKCASGSSILWISELTKGRGGIVLERCKVLVKKVKNILGPTFLIEYYCRRHFA